MRYLKIVLCLMALDSVLSARVFSKPLSSDNSAKQTGKVTLMDINSDDWIEQESLNGIPKCPDILFRSQSFSQNAKASWALVYDQVACLGLEALKNMTKMEDIGIEKEVLFSMTKSMQKFFDLLNQVYFILHQSQPTVEAENDTFGEEMDTEN